MRKYILILSALVLLASGQELVLNGDFENGLDSWTMEINNNQGSYAVEVCTSYHPDPGYAVRIYKYMRFYAKIDQVVEIPSTAVRFSASSRLLASKGTASGYYAYAMLSLEYLHANGGTLGRSLMVKWVGDYPPQSNPYQHVHRVYSNNWEDYEFVLADELANLTGVNPANVNAVRIVLESYGTGAAG